MSSAICNIALIFDGAKTFRDVVRQHTAATNCIALGADVKTISKLLGHSTVQPFPNHFHEHYVIGFIESGERCLSCKNMEYVIKSGDIVLFNLGDNHACVQSDDGTLDYRGFNISKETIAIAKAQGKYKGIKPIAVDKQLWAELFLLWKSGEISAVEFMRRMGLSKSTFYRRIHIDKQNIA